MGILNKSHVNLVRLKIVKKLEIVIFFLNEQYGLVELSCILFLKEEIQLFEILV